MYVALGFCTAGLIGLAILPAFYRRAARLTEEALRAVNPSSYAEVRASQDQVRAQHAVDLRRVERQLEKEREKAAKFQIDTAALKNQLAELAKSHAAREAELEARIAAIRGDEHAVDMLSSEVRTLKEKLSETEKALSESWTQALEDKPRSEEKDTGLAPAHDTLTLATITGLEAEVATLKARLARYEPLVAGEVEASLDQTAKSRLSELERQLVDVESKYVTAQAEVTRLSIMLDSVPSGWSEVQQRLSEQLAKVTRENTQQQSELEDSERRLKRLSGQVQALRRDLENAPALADLRRDFKALAARISGAEAITVNAAPLKMKTKRPSPRVTIGPAAGTGGLKPPAEHGDMNGGHTGTNGSASGQPSGPGPTSPPKSADIASAAQALVKRVVASGRAHQMSDTAKQPSPERPEDAGSAPEGIGAEKPKSEKQKNKDVA